MRRSRLRIQIQVTKKKSIRNCKFANKPLVKFVFSSMIEKRQGNKEFLIRGYARIRHTTTKYGFGLPHYA